MSKSPPRKKLNIRSRRVARLNAVQALFQMEASGQGIEYVAEGFISHRFGGEVEDIKLAKCDEEFFQLLIAGAVRNQSFIDKSTSKLLVQRWPIRRIDPTLRAVFRAAGAELLSGATSPKIAISEFVEVTKSFFPSGKQANLVNAVLDNMARELVSEITD